MSLQTPGYHVYVHSMRLLSGVEALVARVVTAQGKVGYGFNFRLEATEARHMAEWHAGVRNEPPGYRPALDHPWESAWLAGAPIPWQAEPGFERIPWLPQELPAKA